MTIERALGIVLFILVIIFLIVVIVAIARNAGVLTAPPRPSILAIGART